MSTADRTPAPGDQIAVTNHVAEMNEWIDLLGQIGWRRPPKRRPGGA
jgi:hypothetical protein